VAKVVKMGDYIDLIKKGWRPYFRINEGEIHDSNYACMEIGYCSVKGGPSGDSPATVDENIVLELCSDHITIGGFGLRELPKDINIDCTTDGYYRVWTMDPDKAIIWEDMPVSTAELKVVMNP
jgi:hypothetical protein